jgi:proteasome lid subunit RPN8/RPN11
VYHSHPDHVPEPSAFDREHAWPWLSYVIVGVSQGRAGDLKSWVLAEDRVAFGAETITIEERTVVWQSRS